MNGKTKQRHNRAAAMKLLKDPSLLFRIGEKIGELGVIGEEHNRIILFLAGLTSAFASPVSIIIKGSTSSGKSNLIKNAIKLFPPERVVLRSSLSTKALVHGHESLKGKIFCLHEYSGGKDAQYLLRQQQSEGVVAHEYSTVTGNRRGTEIAHRAGTPVVLTSTTENTIFKDDETRYTTLWADESAEQTLAIVRAAVGTKRNRTESGLPVWREAFRLLTKNPPAYALPQWFDTVAAKLPVRQVRVRRDWQRFLTFCGAIALCSRFMKRPRKSKEREFITFPDYCVAYRVLNPAFSSTVQGVHEREIALAECVRQIHIRVDRAVRIAEVAEELGWKQSLVYKFVPLAIGHDLIRYESGTLPKNVKYLLPVPGVEPGFLPSPRSVFDSHEELGPVAKYVDPLTGKTKILRRRITPTEDAHEVEK